MPRRKRAVDAPLDLFADEPSGAAASLTVNARFARDYDERKRRQDLSLARDLGLVDASGAPRAPPVDEEDESSEDEGDALTPGVDARINETLRAIRERDPRIYEPTTRFFDADGEEVVEVEQAPRVKARPKRTARDTLRDQLLDAAASGKADAFEDDDGIAGAHGRRVVDDGDRGVNPRLYDAEQRALRSAFISTVEAAADSGLFAPMDGGGTKAAAAAAVGAEGGEEGDEEFLRPKVRDREAIARERAEDAAARAASREALLAAMRAKEVEGGGEGGGSKSSSAAHARRGGITRTRGAPPIAEHAQDLADPEGFLTAFLASGVWRSEEKEAEAERRADEEEEDEDDKDSEELWKADEFESKYNFRFEDPAGAQIVTHARSGTGAADASLRRKDTRRADERARKASRAEEMRKAAEAETKRLMALKRAELKGKVGRIRSVVGAGVGSIEELAAAFGDELDTDWDSAAYDRRMAKLFGDDFYAMPETETGVEGASGGKAAAAGGGGEEESDSDSGREGIPAWVFGDGPRPAWAGLSAEELAAGVPDADLGEGPEDIEEEEGVAGMEGEEEVEEEQDAAIVGIRAARRSGKRARAARKRLSAVARAKAAIARDDAAAAAKLRGGIQDDDPDEVLALGFEDVIAGGLRTRFSYKAVEPEDYGLSSLEILLADDADLNAYVGLRRLAPYREVAWKVPKHVGKKAVRSIREKVNATLASLRGGGAGLDDAGEGGEGEEDGGEEQLVHDGGGEGGEETPSAVVDPERAALVAARKERKRERKRAREEAAAAEAAAAAQGAGEAPTTAAEASVEGEEGGRAKKRRRRKEKGGEGEASAPEPPADSGGAEEAEAAAAAARKAEKHALKRAKRAAAKASGGSGGGGDHTIVLESGARVKQSRLESYGKLA